MTTQHKLLPCPLSYTNEQLEEFLDKAANEYEGGGWNVIGILAPQPIIPGGGPVGKGTFVLTRTAAAPDPATLTLVTIIQDDLSQVSTLIDRAIASDTKHRSGADIHRKMANLRRVIRDDVPEDQQAPLLATWDALLDRTLTDIFGMQQVQIEAARAKMAAET